MTAMTLHAFIDTRRKVDNIGEAIRADYVNSPGYVYADDLFITVDGATACLTIYNDSWTVPLHLIGDLEAVLYQWAVGEGFFEDMTEAQRAGTTAASEIAEWSKANGKGQAFALAMIANASRSNAAVCHLQDVCDAWAFLEDCSEEALEDAYAILRAELLLSPSRLYA